MKHRKLRIAWSVAWGIVVVLLCVLWVRSYSTHDLFYGWFHRSGYLQVDSEYGCLALIAVAEPQPPDSRWNFKSYRPEDATQTINLVAGPWGYAVTDSEVANRLSF